jgi:nucleoside phosphorylase
LIGVFTALPEELAPLLARASAPAPAGRGLWRARFGGADLLLGATGDGPARAEGRAREWLGAFPLRALVGTGIAGALSADLREGEVIAAREVRAGGGASWSADPVLFARAKGAADRAGVLVCGTRPCFTAVEKTALLAGHPDAENAAADLESSGWARAAAAAGIPFVAIRAVLDPAGEDFPEAVAGAWSGNGIGRWRVAVSALVRPREIPALWRLRRRTRRAMEAIARRLPAILRAEA